MGSIADWIASVLTGQQTLGAARARLTTHRSGLEEAIRKAELRGTLDPRQGALRDNLILRFQELAKRADETAADPDEITEEAQDLARARAYLLPAEELPFEARLAFTDLHEWRVPDASLAEVKELVGIVEASWAKDPARARAALDKVFATQDYWSSYASWFITRMEAAFRILFLVAILMLLLAIGLSCVSDGGMCTTALAFLFAGIAGSAISIMTRRPTLTAYGDSADVQARILGRIAIGIAATMIGFGFLASGLLNVSLTIDGAAITPSVIIARAAGPWPEAPTKTAIMEADAPTKTARAELPPHRSKTVIFGILLAIAILLGFSERALARFENTIFGDPALPSPPALGAPSGPPSPTGSPKPPSVTAARSVGSPLTPEEVRFRRDQAKAKALWDRRSGTAAARSAEGLPAEVQKALGVASAAGVASAIDMLRHPEDRTKLDRILGILAQGG